MPIIGSLNFRHNRSDKQNPSVPDNSPLEGFSHNNAEPIRPEPERQILDIQQVFNDKSLTFNKLALDQFFANNDIKSANFVSGVSGWQIKGDGTAEYD